MYMLAVIQKAGNR